MPRRLSIANQLKLILVVLCLYGLLLISDEAQQQQLKCFVAIKDLALSRPRWEKAAEEVRGSLNMTFPFCDLEAPLAACEDRSVQFSFSGDLIALEQNECGNAGGRFEIFTGLQSCDYFGGRFIKGKHETQLYINRGQCFAPTGCEGYTIESYLTALAKLVVKKGCTYERQDPPFHQAAVPPSSAASNNLTSRAIIGIAVSYLLVIGGLVLCRRRERANKARDAVEFASLSSAIDDEEEQHLIE